MLSILTKKDFNKFWSILKYDNVRDKREITERDYINKINDDCYLIIIDFNIFKDNYYYNLRENIIYNYELIPSDLNAGYIKKCYKIKLDENFKKEFIKWNYNLNNVLYNLQIKINQYLNFNSDTHKNTTEINKIYFKLREFLQFINLYSIVINKDAKTLPEYHKHTINLLKSEFELYFKISEYDLNLNCVDYETKILNFYEWLKLPYSNHSRFYYIMQECEEIQNYCIEKTKDKILKRMNK